VPGEAAPPDRDPVFCRDAELGYLRSRTRFAPGEGLRLDESYRLAHLPLVAPDHPRVIPSRADGYYRMGRHERTYSVALPIPSEALFASAAYLALDAEMRDAPFAQKITWPLLHRRRDRLHATLCSTLSIGPPPVIADSSRAAVCRLGPFHIELRGPFSGDRNLGRLYLRAYPERGRAGNACRAVQQAFGRPETDLYLVGLYNFIDDLDAGETSALASLVERWWDRPILRLTVDRLWPLSACDDLVLDGAVEEILALV
jgi:hypothetical protein